MIRAGSSRVVACYRFMRLFGASLFSVIRVSDNSVDAIVAWPEDCREGILNIEDTQLIRCSFNLSAELNDALTVGEFAYDAGWISLDAVSIREQELQKALGWDAGRVNRALHMLLSLRVRMIDDGVETDSFLLHTK